MSGWDEHGQWKWGRHGQRLTDQEREQRHRDRTARRNKQQLAERRAEQVRLLDDKIAYQLWAAGQLVPDRITACLDAQGLEGPEVDVACLAREPEVDLWEAGVLYPSWEQTLALAHLCHVTPRFLMHDYKDSHTIDPRDTTLRFHLPAHAFEDDGPPVLRFTEAAIRARMSGLPIELPEPPPTVRPGQQIPLFDPEPAR